MLSRPLEVWRVKDGQFICAVRERERGKVAYRVWRNLDISPRIILPALYRSLVSKFHVRGVFVKPEHFAAASYVYHPLFHSFPSFLPGAFAPGIVSIFD